MSPPCNLHYVEFGVNRGDSLEDFVNRDFRKDGGLQKALADATRWRVGSSATTRAATRRSSSRITRRCWR